MSKQLLLFTLLLLPFPPHAAAQAPAQILNRDQAGTRIPATVFFNGQTSPTEARNSAGIQVADKLMLTALTDTSGYSSEVQQRYQACLLTTLPLNIAGHILAPGAYGYGFLANHTAILMDLGGNELFHTSTSFDPKIARPTPLQILRAASGTYRLYLGRTYITLKPATK